MKKSEFTNKRKPVADEIYSSIKHQILSYTLSPGEKINIDQLARGLHVSNIPIREALSRLASEGLVHIVPYKGVTVAEMSLQELDELYELRIELEGYATRKATYLIPEAELNWLDDEMNGRRVSIDTAQGNLETVMRMNEQLHGTILKYTHNDNLSKLMTTFLQRIERYLIYARRDLAVDTVRREWHEHQEILTFLKQRNSSMAEKAMRTHISNSHQRTRRFFQ
ncbi:GntR family transcriptional regulator [Paenibacillus xerothermodurans]|uniref:GntR family transcriptional regulator n=1 Tax=Paenibacillus xerothermodurans TaxID=1977292 RepID=A0A2W1NZA8_PAEXE|nr:GntR family transcriptional regulator [Paenibacillus xerothermodurans]PZE20188.1 GntR family transcriptional regulator [Paenibacillus xerothermodurans]